MTRNTNEAQHTLDLLIVPSTKTTVLADDFLSLNVALHFEYTHLVSEIKAFPS